MPIWRDGGFGMANTKPLLTVMEKAADPIPASRVLFWGGACTILFGLGSLVAAPTFNSIRRIPQRPSRPTRVTLALQRFRALVLALRLPSSPRVTAEEGISSSNSSPEM